MYTDSQNWSTVYSYIFKLLCERARRIARLADLMDGRSVGIAWMAVAWLAAVAPGDGRADGYAVAACPWE